MKQSILVLCLMTITLPARGQSADPPRATASEAGAPQLVLNEVNTAEYPDIWLFLTLAEQDRPIKRLTGASFSVHENDTDQQPIAVESVLPPMSVVLALDTSGSMAPWMAETQRSALAFVEKLRDADSAQILTLDPEPRAITPMTDSREVMAAAIQSLAARGEAALYDGIFESVLLAAEQPGRKAVIVLSTGVGAAAADSQHTPDDALAAAQRLNVPVYVIGLGAELDDPELKRIPSSTGGLYAGVQTPDDIQTAYRRIGSQLADQYAIRYTSSLPLDTRERSVAVTAAGMQASKAYTAPGPELEPPSAPDAPSASCLGETGLRDALAAMAVAKGRFDDGLTDIAALSKAQRTFRSALTAELDRSGGTPACIEEALILVKDLYEARLITIVTRNALRERLFQRTLGPCREQAAQIDLATDCLAHGAALSDRSLIDAAQRNALRTAVWKPLLASLVSRNKTPAATEDLLRLVEQLFVADQINIVQRNEARGALLR